MLPPIIVTGTPRSGKSVICRTIIKEQGFQWVREPQMIWNMGMGSREDDCRLADEATPELAEKIRRECLDLLEKPDNTYIDDLSYHALRIPFLHAVMPEAKIIHVVRKPELAIPEMLFGWTYRDSVSDAFTRRKKSIRLRGLPRMAFRFTRNYVSSRLKGSRVTWGPRVPNLAEFVSLHSPAEIAAFQWKSMIEIALDELSKIPKQNVIQVQFDALLQNPKTQALRIGEFCSVKNPEGFAEEATNFIDPDFKFDRKVNPTDVEWAKINPIIEQARNRIDSIEFE
ncbi:MAG: hypothetical protein QF718_01360 [Phycisphaerales bacterium]|jgi:hypothetical protein|nr:hypothetical protein [Phycisphaerales bacterium]